MTSKSLAAPPAGAARAPRPDPSAARQARLGLVVLLLALATVLFVVWLAVTQSTRDYALYDVELRGQVQGLGKGGAVMINGVRTGEVVSLALDRNDPTKVVARIRVGADAPVRADSTASLEWLGVSGSRYLQLTGGTLSKPLLREPRRGGPIPVIHAAPGALDSKNPNNKPVATQAIEALDLINQRLSDKNLAAIAAALEDVRTTADAWRGDARGLAALDAKLVKVSQLTDALSKTTEDANGKMNGEWRRQLAQIADGTAESKASLRRLRAQLAQGGAAAADRLKVLPAISAQAQQAEAMVARAGAVVEKLDQGALLGAPKGKEMKVDQGAPRGAPKGKEIKVPQ